MNEISGAPRRRGSKVKGPQTLGDKSMLEFFSGVGLVHEALAPLGWNTALANDHCPKKVRAYRENYPTTPVAECDIRDLPIDANCHARLATASFPCIDLSQAGGRRGIDGKHSSIVWVFLDQIARLATKGRAPEFLLIENVPGLLTHHGGYSIDVLLKRISEIGYAVDLIQVDARHFLPQARNRVFIIGVFGKNRFPRVTEIPDCHIRRYKVREAYERNPDLPWVFFDFPELPRRSVELSDILEKLRPSHENWWDSTRMEYFWDRLEHGHAEKLDALRKTKRKTWITAVRRGRRRGVREQIINLRFDGLASCLRTPKGGSSTQFIVEANRDNVRVRRILGIESARLQGVCLDSSSPDFRLCGSESNQLFAFGDAVCTPVVRWVVENSIERVIAGDTPMGKQFFLELS
jgi:DNA (cytosine-5)-methyltransferase 1